MAIIKSGATSDQLTIDVTSKAARVTEYDTTGRVVAPQSVSAYSASSTFTPASTPTDLILIGGSATKTVRVLAMILGTANTAAGSQIFYLIKRSAANTSGTFVAPAAIPFDTANAAATAVVGHYTGNPTLGATLGTMNTVKIASPVVTPATFAGIVRDAGYDMLQFGMVPQAFIAQAVTLRGTAQQLVVNFNGVALVSGQIHHYTILWTEE